MAIKSAPTDCVPNEGDVKWPLCIYYKDWNMYKYFLLVYYKCECKCKSEQCYSEVHDCATSNKVISQVTGISWGSEYFLHMYYDLADK